MHNGVCITCFFVDRDRRREGVASVALRGALREIAQLGGGTVESYPQADSDPFDGIPPGSPSEISATER